jgi:hypothetical protein
MTFDIREFRKEHGGIWLHSHGYDMIYRCQDGEALCGQCVKDNLEVIEESAADVLDHATGNLKRDWHIVAIETVMDYEPEDYPKCSNCYKTIGAEEEQQ